MPSPSTSTSRTKSAALRRRHVAVEGQREQRVHAQIGQQPRLGAQRRQAEGIGRRTEKFLRMRLEASTASGAPARFGLACGLGDQGAMAAMHAIEIADRHHRAFQRRRGTSSKWRKILILVLGAAGRLGASTSASASSTSLLVDLADAIHDHVAAVRPRAPCRW